LTELRLSLVTSHPVYRVVVDNVSLTKLTVVGRISKK
jgi:hypothetical protein